MAKATESGISKMDAVRAAVKDLGKDAMPKKILEYVKEKFGMEMSTAHVSNYKTAIVKKKKGKKATAQTDNGPATAVTSVKAPSTPAKGSSISLDEIEVVRKLVGRVGGENLRSLIKLFRE